MHCASAHLATEHCVLRLSNFLFRRELGGTVGHSLHSAFSFGQVFATAPDTDVDVVDVRGICGRKSIGSCSHGGCT
jgi:hypothetical protein